VAADLRPGPDEYAPFYARYVARVEAEAEPLLRLHDQHADLDDLVHDLSDAQARFRYAPGKWSVTEVVGHLADAERVFAYRALRIGRGDPTPLATFDEDAYVAASGVDARPLVGRTRDARQGVFDEFVDVRLATGALFRGFPDEAFARVGTASGHPVSVRALLSIILGHTEHHLAVLRERYLSHPDFPR